MQVGFSLGRGWGQEWPTQGWAYTRTLDGLICRWLIHKEYRCRLICFFGSIFYLYNGIMYQSVTQVKYNCRSLPRSCVYQFHQSVRVPECIVRSNKQEF